MGYYAADELAPDLHGLSFVNERLFVAVMLPESSRKALEARLDAAAPLPGRVVPPPNWHLTLRFLGDTAREMRSRLDAALHEAALGDAFPLGLGGWGAFPRPARASVLWMGVEQGTAGLCRLADTVERIVRALGFPVERRPFSPHLTLARIRPPEDVRALLQSLPAVELEWTVVEVALVQSLLGGGPPRYKVLKRFPLDAPKP